MSSTDPSDVFSRVEGRLVCAKERKELISKSFRGGGPCFPGKLLSLKKERVQPAKRGEKSIRQKKKGSFLS